MQFLFPMRCCLLFPALVHTLLFYYPLFQTSQLLSFVRCGWMLSFHFLPASLEGSSGRICWKRPGKSQCSIIHSKQGWWDLVLVPLCHLLEKDNKSTIKIGPVQQIRLRLSTVLKSIAKGHEWKGPKFISLLSHKIDLGLVSFEVWA